MSLNVRRIAISCVVGVILFVSLSRPVPVHAEPMREFVMSASYGVLAGTLVGAASLAFSDKPGDNLNKVARGASFGLYAGILLGLYVVYGVPNQEEEAIRNQLGKVPEIHPLFDERGLAGAEVRLRVLDF